ncbi:restriction endonuclease subunit S [Vibrio cholerae]
MVPNGWEAHHLEELSTKISDGIHTTPKYADSSSVYFVNGNNLKNGQIVIQESTKFVDEIDAEKHRKELSDRTILMSINGTIGNLAYYRGENVVLGKSACFINVKKNVDVDFIYNVLNSEKTQAFYISELTGSTIKNLSLKTIKLTKVNLPPLPEQQKIAKILATWDKTIATTEKLIATSQQQKKALMQQLLTGKKRLVNPESGKVFEGDWEEVKLNKCVKFLNGQRKPIKQEDRANIQGKYPYYGATGIIDYVNDYIFDDEIILLGEDGENILSRVLPHVFVVKGKVWVNNHAHVLKANANMDTNFLCMYLESLDYKRYNSGSAQPKINKAVCEKIPVMVPVLAEQQKIATILTAADREIELLQAKLAHLREEKKALMQQLLTGKRRVKVDENVAA